VKSLRARPFRLLLGGQTVSSLGDWMATFAFIALVYEESGSSTAVAGILALRLLPAALGGPFTARIASVWPRRRTMITMDLARAGMVALVPLVGGLWWIYLWGSAIELGSLVFLPARDALIPDLIDDDDLESANGLVLGSSYGMIPVGGAMYALVAAIPASEILGRPFALVFVIDALTFLVSALMIGRIRTRRPALSPVAAPTAAEAPAAVAGGSDAHAPDSGAPDSSEQPVRFRDAFRLPLVRAVMPATIAVALGLGALFSLGIAFVRTVLDASNAEFGWLIALFGVGAAAGLLALQRVGHDDGLRTTRLGVFALGGIVALFSLSPSVNFALIGALAFGGAAAWTLASGMSTIQSQLTGRDRVLAFAAFHIVIRGGLTLAALGAGIAGQVVGAVHWPLVGQLEPARLVLFCSGIVVAMSATWGLRSYKHLSSDERTEVAATGGLGCPSPS
jgi:predicted MFS family arabinose efflux permease